MRDRDPRDPESPLVSEPGAASWISWTRSFRIEDGNQGHQVVDLTMLHWLDVMFHTSLILLELIISQ